MPTDQRPTNRLRRALEFALVPGHWYLLPLLVAADMLIESAIAGLGTTSTQAFVIALPLNVVVVALATVRFHQKHWFVRALAGFCLVWLLLWPSLDSLQHDVNDVATVLIFWPVLLVLGALFVVALAHTSLEKLPPTPTRGTTTGTTEVVRSANSHVNKDGTPKIPYWSYTEADNAAQELTKKDGAVMNVYECSTCHALHVGHDHS